MDHDPTSGSAATDSYEIRVQGHLDPRWEGWFDGMTLIAADGETRIRGPVSDQAALHGLLARLRDLGLPLVSVVQIAPGASR